MNNEQSYSVFYRMDIRLIVNKSEVIEISPSDIVSLTIMSQYDTATYPMIRLRLYADITMLQDIVEYPDKLELRGALDGGVYRIEPNASPVQVSPVPSIQMSYKVYIEYKNTPTSKMDQYVNGLPRTTTGDLNINNKVPIELFCYDDTLIHRMNDKPPAVYKDMNVPTVIESMFSRCKIYGCHIDTIQNQKRYKQILVPNLTMIDALSFFDVVYGLYPKGGMLFGDLDGLYLSNLASDNGTVPIPIYVKSYKNSSDSSGLMKTAQGYFMQTEFSEVSILSESDIERVLMSETLVSENVITFKTEKASFTEWYRHDSKNGLITEEMVNSITPFLILHKNPSDYVASMSVARVNEKITRIDISGAGFDVSKFKPTSRFNLIFESPIRGMNAAYTYRPSFVCHVISPTSQELFSATTTMSLCRN